MTDEVVEVSVDYHGVPVGDQYFKYFNVSSLVGKPLIWTLSQPFGARSWWPCKDHPSDKADSVDIRIQVPTGLLTASNGTRVEETDDGTWAVTRWRERYPISTYLVFFSSYDYVRYSDWYVYAPTDSMEIQFYTRQPNAATDKIKHMLAAYASLFGEYPFIEEKYGQAIFGYGGGMEHQTCSSSGALIDELLNAHELTHQWWGNMVTCATFNHIWLNEGPATYGESLWLEDVQGQAAYHADLQAKKYLGPGTIYVPDETDVDRVFNVNLSYYKASWVLHMLRHVLGDSTFFASLQAYRQNHAFGTATTADFQAACEDVSGLDLDRFFAQWINGEYYPQYRYGWLSHPVSSGYELWLQLEQIQPWQLFAMPIDVVVTTASGTQTFVAMDSLATQVFRFELDGEPLSVSLDPEEWILRTVEANQSGVEEGPPPRKSIIAVTPNPARRDVAVHLRLEAAGAAKVRIFNVRGALVRRMGGELPAGEHELTWDGRSDDGRQLPHGLYWIQVDTPTGMATERLVLVR